LDDTTRMMDRYREAWARNDWDAATSLWSDGIVHHVSGRHRLAGTFTGKQVFLDHFGAAFAERNGTIEVVEIHGVLTSPDHAVALVRERAVRGDRSLDFDRTVVYHVREGRIVETWSHDFDPYALDEFWG
jgi:ketosteroid isomerase-like protein